MKKILKPLSLILLLAIELSNYAVAQSGINTYYKTGEMAVPVKNTPVYEGSKNNQVAVLEIDFPEVAATFSKMYHTAQSPLWFKDGKYLHVYFQQDGSKVRAALTLKGGLVYAITYLNTSHLPEKIGEAIFDAYSSYSVSHAKQIKTTNSTVYHVLLENNSGFITILADDDEVIEIKRMRKL